MHCGGGNFALTPELDRISEGMCVHEQWDTSPRLGEVPRGPLYKQLFSEKFGILLSNLSYLKKFRIFEIRHSGF